MHLNNADTCGRQTWAHTLRNTQCLYQCVCVSFTVREERRPEAGRRPAGGVLALICLLACRPESPYLLPNRMMGLGGTPSPQWVGQQVPRKPLRCANSSRLCRKMGKTPRKTCPHLQQTHSPYREAGDAKLALITGLWSTEQRDPPGVSSWQLLFPMPPATFLRRDKCREVA